MTPQIDKAWIARMRDMHRPFAGSTHYDGCESGHPRCALILALDEIERLGAHLELAAGSLAEALDKSESASEASDAHMTEAMRALVAFAPGPDIYSPAVAALRARFRDEARAT